MFERIFTREQDFSQVSEGEDCESLITNSTEPKTPSRLSKSPLFQSSTALLFIVTVLISTVFGVWLGKGFPMDLDVVCTKQVSQYSPLMPDVDISYNIVNFNGSLLKENVYRQNAGPEVDAAWEALGVDYRAAIVPRNLAAKSGLTPDQVQVAGKYGGGYPANVEGLHHLHCLNLLRQSLYYNFDYYHALGKGAFLNSDEILRFHVSHCLDILRQQLMCTVDVAVLGQVWWNKESPTAYPDFNTKHKCRNFEDVRSWAEAHQAPLEVPEDYLMNPKDGDVFPEIP